MAARGELSPLLRVLHVFDGTVFAACSRVFKTSKGNTKKTPITCPMAPDVATISSSILTAKYTRCNPVVSYVGLMWWSCFTPPPVGFLEEKKKRRRRINNNVMRDMMIIDWWMMMMMRRLINKIWRWWGWWWW